MAIRSPVPRRPRRVREPHGSASLKPLPLMFLAMALPCATGPVTAAAAGQAPPVPVSATASDGGELAPALVRLVRATLRDGAAGVDAAWRTLQQAQDAPDGRGIVLEDGTRLVSFDRQAGRDGGVATIELALPSAPCVTSRMLQRAALAAAGDSRLAPTWMARVRTFQTPRGGVFHSFDGFDVDRDACIERIYLWRKPVDDFPYYDVDGDGQVLDPDFADRARWRRARVEHPPLHGDEPGDRPPPDICFVDDIRSQVAFEPGSAELAPCAMEVLDEAAAAARRSPDVDFAVAGHADAVEGRGDGEALSLRRARAAYGYLLRKGVRASNIVDVVGYGDARPRVAEDADAQAGEQENRRVELDVRGGD